ncbi:MAG: quinate 5-dehydrogenase [Actinobacteria bacterium]|nr:MAG: quinate 5-dehydrogenase [Actinomycetota bacterium]
MSIEGVKEVVSVSIGSSKRNHEVKVNLLGQDFAIKRVGTNGDFKKAVEMIKELDGKVSAFGAGGIDLYFVADGKKYAIRDAKKLKKAAVKTPLVDGSGLKDTLERETVHYIQDQGIVLKDKKVLMVSAVDRFGMAEALVMAGCHVLFGDLIFGLGIPIPIRKFSTFKIMAKILLPIVVRLPFKVLYPTGSGQEKESTGKYAKYYRESDILAGDFHFIKLHAPLDLRGKIVLTNTTTKEDVEELKKRGVSYLITTTPVFDGRSFGTNVMEATLVSILNKNVDNITSQDYLKCLKELDFKPRVEKLNG